MCGPIWLMISIITAWQYLRRAGSETHGQHTWPCMGPSPPIWNMSHDITSVCFLMSCGAALATAQSRVYISKNPKSEQLRAELVMSQGCLSLHDTRVRKLQRLRSPLKISSYTRLRRAERCPGRNLLIAPIRHGYLLRPALDTFVDMLFWAFVVLYRATMRLPAFLATQASQRLSGITISRALQDLARFQGCNVWKDSLSPSGQVGADVLGWQYNRSHHMARVWCI